MNCVARSTVKGKWLNAILDTVTEDGVYDVLFTDADCGHSELVTLDCIHPRVEDIPKHEMNEGAFQAGPGKHQSSKNQNNLIDTNVKEPWRPWKVKDDNEEVQKCVIDKTVSVVRIVDYEDEDEEGSNIISSSGETTLKDDYEEVQEAVMDKPVTIVDCGDGSNNSSNCLNEQEVVNITEDDVTEGVYQQKFTDDGAYQDAFIQFVSSEDKLDLSRYPYFENVSDTNFDEELGQEKSCMYPNNEDMSDTSSSIQKGSGDNDKDENQKEESITQKTFQCKILGTSETSAPDGKEQCTLASHLGQLSNTDNIEANFNFLCDEGVKTEENVGHIKANFNSLFDEHVETEENVGDRNIVNQTVGEIAKVDNGDCSGLEVEISCIGDYVEEVAGSQDDICAAATGDTKCFAKWREDHGWYRAEVVQMIDDHEVEVLFVDHGNIDIVSVTEMVTDVFQIPPEDALDEPVLDLFNSLNATVNQGNVQAGELTVDSKAVEQEITKQSESPFAMKNTILEGERCGTRDIKGEMLNDRVLYSLASNGKEKTSDCEATEVFSGDRVALKTGDMIFAKWSDETWYNAQVEKTRKSGVVSVTFIDFGNVDTVCADNIVVDVNRIPDMDLIDDNVCSKDRKCVPGAPNVKKEEACDIGSTEVLSGNGIGIQAGDMVFAKWSDDVWYNAEIAYISSHEISVEFVDYGNVDEVCPSNIVHSVDRIPIMDSIDDNVHKIINMGMRKISTVNSMENDADPNVNYIKEEEQVEKWTATSSKCCLCTKIAHRPMKLVCQAGTIVCWGCGVMEINRTRTCWLCGRFDITSDDHLEKEEKVDSDVLQNNDINIFSEDGESHQQPSICNASKDIQISDACFAKWSDGAWYRAQILSTQGNFVNVLFTDWGNTDTVSMDVVVKSFQDIPSNSEICPLALETYSAYKGLDEVDINFLLINYPSIREKDPLSRGREPLKKKFDIKIKAPIGIAMLTDNETLLVASREDNTVYMYSREGKCLGQVRGNRAFSNPTDILVMKSGHFIVRDGEGLQMFSHCGEFVCRIGEMYKDSYFGVTEDEFNIITINCNNKAEKIKDEDLNAKNVTEPGHTDVFFFDKESRQLVRKMEMDDLIRGQTDSFCRQVVYDTNEDRLYILDKGQNRIFCVYEDDGEESAGVIGDFTVPGEYEFKKPSSLLVDDYGTMIITDSGNNRLVLVDAEWNYCGEVLVRCDICCLRSRPVSPYVARP